MTPKQIKAKFEAEGRSVAQWAREHNFPSYEVYRVLNGFTAAKRGRAHDIAVALGLKPAPRREHAAQS